MCQLDGNAESSQKATLNAADSIAQGAASVSPNGSNPWGVPQKDVRELLGRIHGHLAGRSDELQNALKETLTKTAGATIGDPVGQLGGMAQNLGFPRSRPTSPAPPGAQGTSMAPAVATGLAGPPAGNPIMEMLQKEALVIVDIVMKAVQQWYKDGKLNLKCVPSPSPRKSSVLTKVMLPQTSKVADPATTMSVPRPLFASPVSSEEPTSFPGQHASPLSGGLMTTTTTTTFVSPESTTEITWLAMPPTPLGLPINPVRPITHFETDPVSAYITPDEISPCHSRRGASPLARSTVPELHTFSFPLPNVRRHRSEPSAVLQSTLHPARSHNNRLLDCAASEGHITSFPALMTRHSTDDWLIPPADVNQARQESPPHRSQDIVGQTPCYTRIVSVAPSSDNTSRRISASPQAKQRFPYGVGSAIGISSGRRKSSRGLLGDGHSSAPSALKKLRNLSLEIGKVLSSALVGDTGTSTQRRDSSVARMEAILDKFPPLPQPDNSGIFEALTGAQRPGQYSPPWRRDRAGRVGTCSEDGLPHVCRVASDGSSSPTVTIELSGDDCCVGFG